MSKEKKCEYCSHSLMRDSGDVFDYLYCPNEMCLFDEQIEVDKIEETTEPDPYPHLADMKDFDYDGWME